MNFNFKRNIVKTRGFFINLLKIAIGTAMMAVGTIQLLLPSQLSTGGFSGIGTVLYYMSGISVGTTTLILNIPLFLISYFKVGRKFFLNAVIGTVSLSYFLNLFEQISPITTDRVLACLYGGIIIGIGTAVVLKANASTGGTDLVASVIRSYKPRLKTGTLIVLIDTIIVIVNTLYFKDIEVALYSALAIYIMGKILDIFFEGIDFAKMLIIISPQWEEISNRINQEIRRGTTAIYGRGMYKKEKNIKTMWFG